MFSLKRTRTPFTIFNRSITYDLVVIGGGPGEKHFTDSGGYVGAIKAAQLGLKVGFRLS